MLYLDKNTSIQSAEECEVIPLDPPTTLSLRKHSTGKILSVNPSGVWEERDDSSIGGPWETFIRTPTALVAVRNWDGKFNSYVYPYVETT